jgi:thymidylate synthase (FAD)
MTSNSTVTLVDFMGSDHSVVDAARVSFSKEASAYTSEQNQKLISFLAREGHWSPFAHTSLSFRIEAPIFVARQLGKHQVGLSWNEVSRRYVTIQPKAWSPKFLRKVAANVKQGSSDEAVDNERSLVDFNYAVGVALRTYESLLRDGVCPEQARAVLPQGMFTEWMWTGSLYAFHRVYTQRSSPHAQRETKEVVKHIGQACAIYFPHSWLALTTQGEVCSPAN